MQSIANLDASGMSKDLFVQFVDDGCLLDKEISLTWSGQLYIIAVKNNIRQFLKFRNNCS